MQIKALIVDDEVRARSRLRRLLEPHNDVVVVGEAGEAQTALSLVLERRPDVLFLDIDMPGLKGTELAARLKDYLPETVRPAVVFTTAHAEHAVEAFGLESLDYLLKPVERERLAGTLRRLRRQAWSGGAPAVPAPTQPVPTVTSQVGSSIEAVPIGAIESLEVEDGVVFAHTDDGEQHQLTPSLAELESQLPGHFLRISRGAMVNVQHCERMRSKDNGWYAELGTGRRLKVSRRRTKALKAALGVE